MKNLNLLREDVAAAVASKTWTCECGQTGLRFSVTRKGTVQAHCFWCGGTIFFNDPAIFTFQGGPWVFLKQEKQETVTKFMSGGGTTSWYPKCRVRTFRPKKQSRRA